MNREQNIEKIEKIKITLSSVLNREQITLKLNNFWTIDCRKKIVILGFCIKISVSGEFFIKKFQKIPGIIYCKSMGKNTLKWYIKAQCIDRRSNRRGPVIYLQINRILETKQILRNFIKYFSSTRFSFNIFSNISFMSMYLAFWKA